MRSKKIYSIYIKRILDFFLSLILLIVLSPIIAILYVLIKTKLGSPVIFKQQRPGKDEKIFTMYKFRSMTNEKDEYGNLLPDEVRLTRFGKLLRSTSLDELPELINVIKGDMSLVGPRPLLVEYLERYDETQKRRHEVRPGITGLAQVSGRNLLAWNERFIKDIEYVNKISIFLDIKILFKTIKKVLIKEGISSKDSATMSIFLGSKQEDKGVKYE